MNKTTLDQKTFVLHVKQWPGFDEPVLCKEPASDQPLQADLDHLHNEYAVTRHLDGVNGVRKVLAKKGSESHPVLILQYVPGRSLSELVRENTLGLIEKLRLAVSLSRILEQVHTRHVMHRRLNSSNFLVAESDSPGSEGGVYLTNFGLAAMAVSSDEPALPPKESQLETLAYMSPEQTGRLNRQVDYRSDLYSLGMVLYELFAGRLPFENVEAHELVHDQIARRSAPAKEFDAEIPNVLSDIVSRLLEKDADDRYQTAGGLRSDLETCLEQFENNGRVEPFVLGRGDVTGELRFPRKLYGREAEMQQVQSTLDRAITEQAQLLLVAGYSGVGKTALVHGIRKSTIDRNGTYIEGKFDQLQRTQPYSAWNQAFTELVNHTLAQSESSIADWRKTVLDAVGDHGQVLLDVVPVMERVLGPQPGLPELRGVENQNRISHFFNRFIECTATPERPLVVFLDDLQWIDPASLKLIETLVTGQSAGRLLVIGAYRSNEVGITHPLAISRDRLLAGTDRVTVLQLQDLSSDAINQLLSDTLRPDVADSKDLANILVEKTAGNPFFFRQLLIALAEDGLLAFDREQRRWMWDDSLGDNVQVRGSVVDLMVEKISTLPADCRQALSLAACIGSRFGLTILHTIVDQPRDEVLAALVPALQDGLLLRSDGHLSFAHDRIQEAGYSLVAAEERPRLHLEIGRALQVMASEKEFESDIFTIVGHLNEGRTLVGTDEERIELAGLNLAAGQRAKTASAYNDAKRYVETGIELLGAYTWNDHYDLTLSLHTLNAELAYLTGSFEEVETMATQVHANARNYLDRARVYMTQIEAATAQSRPTDGLDIGLAALRDLGIDIPERPTPEYVSRLHEDFVGLLTNDPMARLDQLPGMSDERAMTASALLASVMSTSYIANPSLFPVISYHGAMLILEKGLEAWLPFFLGGIALSSVHSVNPGIPKDEARQVVRFTRTLVGMIETLLENPVTARSRTKGLMMLSFTAPWFGAYEDVIEFSRATYNSGHETGDWLYGSYGAALFATQSLPSGLNLSEYRRQLSAFSDDLLKMGQIMTPTILAIHLQISDGFEASSKNPHHLKGAYFDEDDWLSQESSASDIANRHWLSVGKLILAFHFDRDEVLDELAAEAERFLSGGPCHLSIAQFYLYQALSRLRQYEDGNSKYQADTIDLVNQNLNWLSIWSETSPSSFQHKHDLLAAEKSRVSGEFERTLFLYEQAISGARASGLVNEEALANELYARFWDERGNGRFAGTLMREAHSLYLKWGARAKAEHLATRFPGLLAGRSAGGDRAGGQYNSNGILGELDLLTVLKVSQDIAGEFELQSLVDKMMSTIIQTTGAEKGFLLLERAGRWVVEADAYVDREITSSRAGEEIAGSDTLAESIVNYVDHTQEVVVLDNASRSDQFANDNYLLKHPVKSVLCMPLVNRARTVAIVYLENNLASGVFSSSRVAMMNMLSSQMSVSIENARIQAQLKQLLDKQARALDSAENQIRALFETSPMGIGLTTLDGRILSLNRAMLNMLGISAQAELQTRIIDFYQDPEDRARLLDQVEEQGYLQDFGVKLARADGSTFDANLSMSKLTLEGKDVLLGMVQDVTEQISVKQEAAVLEERARLARELHDAVTQTILSASLLADANLRKAEAGLEPGKASHERLSGMMHGALDEMRTLLLDMRPDAASKRTLGQFLSAMVESARLRTPANVILRVEGDRALPENVTTQLQRITQEALGNSIRHANAGTIAIDLKSHPDRGVELLVSDDGCGFEGTQKNQGHYGLGIMAERAAEIGAIFEIQSTPGKGTLISVNWT